MLFQERVPLKNLNTLGINAQARYYMRVGDIRQLQQLLLNPRLNQCPRLILGEGSNVLFLGDFVGIVIHMAIQGIAVVRENQEFVWVRAGAGVNWHTLVRHCVQRGYAGIENLSLIPGTVGAAPIQNIGAYGVTLSNVLESLEAIEVHSGIVRTLSRKDCAFGYRDSIFKGAYKERYIVTSVTLKLHKTPQFRTTYGTLQSTLETMGVQELSIKAISDAIIRIRKSKLPDPKCLGNAGSFFKNPIISRKQFEYHKHTYPDMPGHAHPRDRVKIPAAWLIEQCGWKGTKRGVVGVHRRHALVLVNYGNGTGQDILQLSQAIQQSVHQKFNIKIVHEVQIIG